jgi:hypothetical protein
MNDSSGLYKADRIRKEQPVNADDVFVGEASPLGLYCPFRCIFKIT